MVNDVERQMLLHSLDNLSFHTRVFKNMVKNVKREVILYTVIAMNWRKVDSRYNLGPELKSLGVP